GGSAGNGAGGTGRTLASPPRPAAHRKTTTAAPNSRTAINVCCRAASTIWATTARASEPISTKARLRAPAIRTCLLDAGSPHARARPRHRFSHSARRWVRPWAPSLARILLAQLTPLGVHHLGD